MEKRIANYRVIITKDRYPDGEVVYTAYCPTLHVHDWGPTLEKALAGIKKGIELTVLWMIEDGEKIPVDYSEQGKLYTIAHMPITLSPRTRLVAA